MMVLQAAALLLFLLGLAHSVLGERYILIRLFRHDNLPRLLGGTAFTIHTLRFAWHLTTVAWWGMAVLLWRAAAGGAGPTEVLEVLGWTMLLSGTLPLVLSRGRHPSWLAFFAVGGLALWAASA